MPRKLRARVDMSLRKSPDPKSPQYDEWHDWRAGEVFIPPKHMNLEKCFARGIVEEVSDGEAIRPR